MKPTIKRHLLRSLLFLHLTGLAMALGPRLAGLMIEHQNIGSDLPSLALTREIVGASRYLALSGFLMLVLTGVLMTILRYGWRPPIWVWIKVGTTTIILAVGLLIVAPALEAARVWAHRSVEQGQLAPQFVDASAQASRYGIITLVLFFITIAVAVWKPFTNGVKKAKSTRSAES